MDAYKASYGVEDPEYAVTQLAQTTMRSELGKLSLDKVFRERESLNASIVDAINQASDYWGIRCLRYEIKDIHVPPRVKESMQMQVEAERRKRATVLESEGTRESAINVAEGKKQAQILASEAEKAERINQASGEASAILVKAQAKAEAIRLLGTALAHQNGNMAASLSVAEQYVQAFSQLAKESNTVLLPTNTGDVTSMVAQVSLEHKRQASGTRPAGRWRVPREEAQPSLVCRRTETAAERRESGGDGPLAPQGQGTPRCRLCLGRDYPKSRQPLEGREVLEFLGKEKLLLPTPSQLPWPLEMRMVAAALLLLASEGGWGDHAWVQGSGRPLDRSCKTH
ncbi:stomatin-like protein 2, mitochondrial [Python bivittatus]|uniref:Stomatin-like protein 2, mitochondrial n=1 Tax=Python bivittatus TaxID=176946 RepID=A0A9F2RA64_PYTBI|nr:stomatin-like protein 2, mitochondrial [Python bivittatus]